MTLRAVLLFVGHYTLLWCTKLWFYIPAIGESLCNTNNNKKWIWNCRSVQVSIPTVIVVVHWGQTQGDLETGWATWDCLATWSPCSGCACWGQGRSRVLHLRMGLIVMEWIIGPILGILGHRLWPDVLYCFLFDQWLTTNNNNNNSPIVRCF